VAKTRFQACVSREMKADNSNAKIQTKLGRASKRCSKGK